MKLGLSPNRIVIAVVAVTGMVVATVAVSDYRGLIEFQCSLANGCRIVIDGRS